MKIHLFDIENQIERFQLEEAYQLVGETNEYDITKIEENLFHVSSRQPDYHVEIIVKEDGFAIPYCQCLVFKKKKQCKHALAGLLLLRDQIQRNRKRKKKSNQEILDEVLQKLKVGELKSFLASYALSHSALRAEILSNYLYLTVRPDYHSLYHDLVPIDKYGQIRLNRNNIKTVRAVSTTLLKRAQQLLKEKALSQTLLILEAVLLHLHRLWIKVPQFQDHLQLDIRFAYKIFEGLCAQPMAPRLQLRAINLSIDICARESYYFPAGARPLLSITEGFILEDKLRKEAFALAGGKVLSGHVQNVKWAGLLFHWMRVWSYKVTQPALRRVLEEMLPNIIQDFNSQGEYEDVLFAIQHLKKENYDEQILKSIFQSGLRSAKMLSRKEKIIDFSFELAFHYLDLDGWEILYENDKAKADRVLESITNMNSPGENQEAEFLILNGMNIQGRATALLERLKKSNNISYAIAFDSLLRAKHPEELTELYAKYISNIREAYGGSGLRHQLNNIFSYLKSIDLYQPVAEKIKSMEKAKPGQENQNSSSIKGFVFDLDGVIVDTAVHHFQSWKKVLKELGAEIVEADDHHMKGAGRMESLEYLLHRYHIKLSDEEKQKWASKKNDVYLEAINAITPDDLLPGALNFMEASRKLGLLLALGSASKNARMVLEKLGIKDRFDAILDGHDTEASKPDPEIFIKACAALGLEPYSVVVFEDAPKGVQAALSAGCLAVGIGDVSALSAAQIVIPGLNHSTPSQIIEQLA